MNRHLLLLLALTACAEAIPDNAGCEDLVLVDIDEDGDGYADDLDCDDANGAVHPAAEEICNGIDDDCDGLVDEGSADADEDGIADCLDEEDCDGVDNNGDGTIDEGFPDADGDGDADCIDIEDCDGADNNGDGLIDEGYSDGDGDGVADCVDDEVCNGIDDDGDGLIDDGHPDSDADGIADCVDTCTDSDGDGFADLGFGTTDCPEDLCPGIADDQLDTDGDGDGDACDDDDDDDTIPDVDDNCVTTPNTDQLDTDGDGDGDHCDDDDDDDTIPDVDDNCVTTPNTDQADNDEDGIGDLCDDDDDNDTIPDTDDNCVFTENTDQADADGDGIGDICDGDVDGDTIPDADDNCVFIPNTDQADQDGDGIGDVCDPDRDEDGISNTDDNCVTTPNTDQLDTEGDGIGDLCDDDDDDDTIPDVDDNCVTTPNTDQADNDGDGVGDLCDDDDDDDTIPDVDDNCVTTPNTDQADNDGDGIGDLCDDDDDDDTIPDTDDNCVFIPNTDQTDSDGDGDGDLCDDDDDNDNATDDLDCAPTDATVFPGATETCNGIDDDCDGRTDEGGSDALPADAPRVLWVQVTERAGVDQTDVTVPLSLRPWPGLDLSGMTSANLQVLDATGAPLSFWVEELDAPGNSMLLWVRFSTLPADVETDVLLVWGGPDVNLSDPHSAFDDYVDVDSLPPTPQTVSWDAPEDCNALEATDTTLTALADGTFQSYRPNQSAYYWLPGLAYCGDEVDNLAIRWDASMNSTHFDRDVRGGVVWGPPSGDFLSGEKPTSSTVGLIAETAEASFIFEESCARLYAESSTTTADPSTLQRYTTQIRGNTVLGQVADSPWFHHAIPDDHISQCAWPAIRGNTDAGSEPIDLRVHSMRAYHMPTRTPGIEVCTTMMIPAPSIQDTDSDGQPDSAEPDVDGDGTADLNDCNPWDHDRGPRRTEACNELDDDCDGEVDEECLLEIDWQRPGQFDSQLHLRNATPSGGCQPASVSPAGLFHDCPNNRGMMAMLPIPRFDGTHDLLIDVDVISGAWTDPAPRYGVELFDGWDGDVFWDTTFVGTPGWVMHVSDPVDQLQVGCASENCPSIASTYANAQLAIGGAVIAPFTPYHVAIEMLPTSIQMVITNASTGTLIASLTATAAEPKAGLIGLLCGETSCTWSDLRIQTR